MATQFKLEIDNNSLRLTNRKSGRSLIKTAKAPFSSDIYLLAHLDAFESLLGDLVRELEPVRRFWIIAKIEVTAIDAKLTELEIFSLKTILTNQGYVRVTFA